jgi:uncharacterized protein
LAFSCYEKAAKQNEPFGICNMARFYQDGLGGVQKDEKRGFEIYNISASLKNLNARWAIAHCYEFGRGVEKDEKYAVSLHEALVAEPYPDSQTGLGRCYEFGKGGLAKDQKRAIELYELAAKDSRDGDASYRLGLCYQSGKGVVKDEKRAFELFLRPASTKCWACWHEIEIRMAVAQCYEHGIGTKKNVKLALKHYEETGTIFDCKEAQARFFALKKTQLNDDDSVD